MIDSVILERPLSRVGSQHGEAASKRQRIYIFPTRVGFSYILLLAVMLLGAVNYSNNMAYMLTFLLGSLFLVCMLHTYRNLYGLIVHLSPARPVFAGEPALFPLVFDNRDGPDRFSIMVEPWPKMKKLRKPGSRQVLTVQVDSNQLYRDTLAIPSLIRGYLSPGRLRINSCYPLGLFNAWSWMQGSSRCLVYPKPCGDPRLPVFTELSAEQQSGSRTGTDDFTGFRHYRPGDSIRNIDWKVLAREQGLLVKKFSGSGSRQLVLNWELTAHLVDTETRLSQLALWVIEAESLGLEYGLIMPGDKTEIDHGTSHQQHCLRILATHELARTD